MKQVLVVLTLGALSACSSGVTVPDNATIYEVPAPATYQAPYEVPSTAGASTSDSPFTGSTYSSSQVTTASDPIPLFVPPEAAPASQSVDVSQANPVAGGVTSQPGNQIDDDSLNLNEYSQEQQKIDRELAERELANARSQLVVVPTTGVPNQVQGVNIALFAKQTTNAVGEKQYQRSRGIRLSSKCGRYGTPDEAQRAFLAAGGPSSDSLGLDPDGDGFACKWDPAPYRALSF